MKTNTEGFAQSAPEQAGNMNSLHADIMNIQCKIPPQFTWLMKYAYKIGHRDARHAAAELVSASQTNIPPPEIITDAVEAAGRCTACGEELI